MISYVEIRNYLEQRKHDDIGQFGIDWIERTLDEWEERERLDSKTGSISLDDETMGDATHYEATTALGVLRLDAPCRPFFEALAALTKRQAVSVRPHPCACNAWPSFEAPVDGVRFHHSQCDGGSI